VFLKESYFPYYGMNLKGKEFEQYAAAVLVSLFTWVVVLRHSARRYLARPDVEHVVGPERR
jgi:hypothetical protein